MTFFRNFTKRSNQVKENVFWEGRTGSCTKAISVGLAFIPLTVIHRALIPHASPGSLYLVLKADRGWEGCQRILEVDKGNKMVLECNEKCRRIQDLDAENVALPSGKHLHLLRCFRLKYVMMQWRKCEQINILNM